MEYASSEHPRHALPKEFQASVESSSAAIAHCMSSLDAQEIVDQLNQEAVEAYLLSQNVYIQSDFVVRTRYKMNPKTHIFEARVAPDTPVNVKVEGVFLGFEQYPYEDSSILMYKLGLPYESDDRSFDVVTVPVDEAIMMMALNPEDKESEAEVVMYSNLELLAQLKDKTFRLHLKKFIKLIENTEEIDATFFKKIGDLATQMLAHEDVKDDSDIKTAISTILSIQVEQEWPYDIIGQSFIFDQDPASWRAEYIRASVEIEKVILVNNYEINEKGFLVGSNLLQPAFMIHDNRVDGKVYVPLRYITQFAEKYNDDESCGASIEKYKLLYPSENVA